jgi:hypothetical protein
MRYHRARVSAYTLCTYNAESCTGFASFVRRFVVMIGLGVNTAAGLDSGRGGRVSRPG